MPLLDHVGIKVTDLERSAAFYRDVFGFPEVERRRLGSGTDIIAMRCGTNLLFLQHQPEFQAKDPDALSGVDHFAISFDAAEWEQVTRRTRQLGVRVLRDLPSVQGSTGAGPAQYILDPDGNEIEIKHNGLGLNQPQASTANSRAAPPVAAS